MTVEVKGYVTVAEAAKRLDISEQQVRRKLRGGKLIGRRVGNHWLVRERALEERPFRRPANPLISDEDIEQIRRLRKEIAEYNRAQGNPPIDVVELIRQHRDEA